MSSRIPETMNGVHGARTHRHGSYTHEHGHHGPHRHLVHLVRSAGNFDRALIFLAGNAVAAMLSYLLVVGEIKRLNL